MNRLPRGFALSALALSLGCEAAPDLLADSAERTAGESAVVTDSPESKAEFSVSVLVTLDGEAVEGASVMQAGTRSASLTDASGVAVVSVDPNVWGEIWVIASHADARNWGVEVAEAGSVEIPLVRFDRSDNPAYTFKEAGPESHDGTTTAQCGHCHLSIHQEWYASPHRTSASNVAVQDVYQGIALGLSAESCADGMIAALEPGTGSQIEACGVAESVASTGTTGNCADCHAPGINGEVGGRDLLDARGFEYSEGVSCEVCHHVESVHEGGAPGISGWLAMLRPTEAPATPIFGDFAPLLFGPYTDVINPYMGSVQRDHFHEAAFCGGCHQLDQPVLVAGGQIDESRWPEGVLPVHSTYEEWLESPMNPGAPCQSCHMPPNPLVGNSADLDEVDTGTMPGPAAGWERDPGSVRQHAWYGPRQPDAGMLGLAAALFVETSLIDGVLLASVRVQNVGPGHAIPTGDPLRSLVLRVSASCEGQELAFIGGDTVPSFGGALAANTLPANLLYFPDATPGMVVNFMRRAGWYDYDGFGRFGDGSFSPEEKGLERWEWLGQAVVLAVAENGEVGLDTAAPDGAERSYLISAPSWPEDGEISRGMAGLPGFSFARVLVDAEGNEGVPHHLATDVRADNRLLPQASYTTEHQFLSTCEAPEVRAILLHRAYPVSTAERYGWAGVDQVMAEATR